MKRPQHIDLLVGSYYCTNRQKAISFIRKLSGRYLSFDDIEDILHDALMVALHSSEAWKCSTDVEFCKWMWSTLRNCTLHYLRQRGKWTLHLNGEDAAEWSTEEWIGSNTYEALSLRMREDPSEQWAIRLTVEQMLEHLSEREILLLDLHYWKGHTFEQIAQQWQSNGYSITAAGVRTLHYRIICRLRRIFEDTATPPS